MHVAPLIFPRNMIYMRVKVSPDMGVISLRTFYLWILRDCFTLSQTSLLLIAHNYVALTYHKGLHVTDEYVGSLYCNIVVDLYYLYFQVSLSSQSIKLVKIYPYRSFLNKVASSPGLGG